MIEKSDQKKQDVLDRYEIVGIAVPGAALVAVIWCFAGRPGGTNLTDISIGSLGVITIAAFVAGHVVQSIANVIEDVWAGLWHLPAMIPLDDEALTLDPIERGLRELGLAPYSEKNLHGTRGKELRRIILSQIRAAKRSRMLDNLKITIAVSRGLCVVSVIAIVDVVVSRKNWPDPSVAWVILGAAIAVGVITFARAWRYTGQFEREIWIQFGELSRAKTDA